MTTTLICLFAFFLYYKFPVICNVFVSHRLKSKIQFVSKDFQKTNITGEIDKEQEAQIQSIWAVGNKLSVKDQLFKVKEHFELVLKSKPEFDDLAIENSNRHQQSFKKLVRLSKEIENQNWIFYKSESAQQLIPILGWASLAIKAK